MTIDAAPPTPARPPAGALRVLQLGAIAVIVAVATLHVFELDRFFVPSEPVLHLAAASAGLLALRAIGRGGMTRIDLLLAAYLLLSVISALFAQNPWLAIRAVTISASGVLLFWIARALREGGLARPLLNALAFAVVLAAITSLLQTYGLDISLFAENRAPGGTLGNRNFVAHIAAFGLPLVLLVAFRARSVFPGAIGAMIVIASLVLTRSRAAWLAFAAVMIVFFAAMLLSGALRRDRTIWRRLIAIA